ncbi:unnamed protein product [Leptosia nina]|uniref:SET domain-containing protein n=1 Tax=Leptosia nina TaxID=320188 RepID=A0AAV1JXT9_9NEOP
MSHFNLRKKPRISYYEVEELNMDEYVYAGLGVFAKSPIPSDARFGPYRGRISESAGSNYCWQLYDKHNKPTHVVDASDANNSNWMRYVNCSRHRSEQNLVAFQYQGQMYYRTIKLIPPHTELLVFYGVQFAVKLGIDVRRYNNSLPAVEPQVTVDPVQTDTIIQDLEDTEGSRNVIENTNEKKNEENHNKTPVINPITNIVHRDLNSKHANGPAFSADIKICNNPAISVNKEINIKNNLNCDYKSIGNNMFACGLMRVQNAILIVIISLFPLLRGLLGKYGPLHCVKNAFGSGNRGSNPGMIFCLILSNKGAHLLV